MRLILAAALALMLMQSGCYTSTMKAADFQPHVDSARIQPGITLGQLERILGEDGDPIIGVANGYEFRFEHTEAWPGRKWIYWLIDLPTLGLAGLVTTMPVEFAIEREAQRWGAAIFDDSGALVLFRMSRKPLVVVGSAATEPHPSRPGHFGQYLKMLSGG